jgi:hypothetical protein
MQDILYKLLPQVEQVELEKEKQFYKERGLTCAPKVDLQNGSTHKRRRFGRGQRDISRNVGHSWLAVLLLCAGISWELENSHDIVQLVKNYLWVPGHAKVANVQNYLRKKLHLADSAQALLFVDNFLLHESLTLSTVWKVFFSPGKDKMITLSYGIVSKDKDYFVDDECSVDDTDDSYLGALADATESLTPAASPS